MPKQFEDRTVLLRAAMAVWAAISLVNFTVWAMICVIGAHFVGPFWLWVAVPPAFVLVPLWLRENRLGGGAGDASWRGGARRFPDRDEL